MTDPTEIDVWTTTQGRWRLAVDEWLRRQREPPEALSVEQRPSGDVPQSPADPRFGGRPAFIAPDCATCGVALVCADVADGVSTDKAWHDEFRCPTCGGLYLDVPPPPDEPCPDEIAGNAATAGVSLDPVSTPTTATTATTEVLQ